MPDRRLTYRASILREWQGTEAYAVVMEMLKEKLADRIDQTFREGAAKFDGNAGFIEGLQYALKLADQTELDEQRQRPQEVARG